MDIFQQALSAANNLLRERDIAEKEVQHFRTELESARLALSVAQEEARDSKTMVAELTAQLGVLGKLFITGADEVLKIVNKLNEKVEAEKPKPVKSLNDLEVKVTGTENLEVEIVGPFVGKEGDNNIPFAPGLKRASLLSETATTPAFLHRNHGIGTLSPDIYSQMSSKERRTYHREGVIPTRLRR